jgi:hypothetical protein
MEQGAWGRGSSLKFENSPEIIPKTWNLELGTWNLIELIAESIIGWLDLMR